MATLKEKKAETSKNYKIEIPAQKAGESNYAYAQRLAHQADTRLRRLEQLAKTDPNFENITSWSYAGAMHDIKSLYGGGIRFQRKPSKTKVGAYNEKQIQAQISALKRFLGSPTSMKGTTKAIFKKRADTFNEEFGTDFTWEDIGKFFQSGLADKIDLSYGSDTKLRAVGMIQRNNLQTVEDIKNYRERTNLTSEQEIALSTAETLMSEFGDDIRKQFFK